MSTEEFSKRSTPVLAMVVVLSFTLWIFISRNHEYSGSFPSMVADHRAIVGLLVNVVSSILSALQLFVICSMMNFAFRTRLFRQPAELSDLSFWSAVSSARVEVRLPWPKATFVCFVALVGPILAGLWAGALTPVFTTSSSISPGHALIPLYPTSDYSTFVLNASGTVSTTNCLFSYLDGYKSRRITSCPTVNLMAGLLNSASTASNLTEHRIHPKLNNETWSFQDRSYGVGSSIGIYNSTRQCGPNCVSMSYEETGYSSSVTCTKRNDTTIIFDTVMKDTAVLVLRSESIILPGGVTSPIPAFHIARNLASGAVFAWSANSSTDLGHYLVIEDETGGSDAKFFNHMFCQLAFTPTLFKVTAFMETKLIKVEPLTTSNDPVPVFDPTEGVANQIMKDLDLLSRASATMVVSSLTNAITASLNIVNATHIPRLDMKRAAEIAMENSLVALVDDLLLARGAAQTSFSGQHPENRGEADATTTVTVVKLGSAAFDIIQMIITSLIAVLFVAEAFRTRFWAALPRFDFVDLRAVVAACLSGIGNPGGHHEYTPLSASIQREKRASTVIGQYVQSEPTLRCVSTTETGNMLRPRARHAQHVSNALLQSSPYHVEPVDLPLLTGSSNNVKMFSTPAIATYVENNAYRVS
ncbi:hypothetical protein LTR84_010677 [Exophiala bonariae]|uniref:Membrane-associated protein n=1 Tax=Exophiala bonariae TaxID=1690606 RepID=A0AAV9MSL1_9EURO|nr:hypothetical protein LTR84_010677 [Exophiala bonariae]